MADDPKDMCKHCGHTRESHKMTAKNRENVKMLRKNGGGSKDRYEYSFRNCPRFNPEDKT